MAVYHKIGTPSNVGCYPERYSPERKQLMRKLLRIAPEVPVADVRAAIEYYDRKLGFQLAMLMSDGNYAIVERDDVAIHLFRNDSGHELPAAMHIFAQGLDELHAELQERGASVIQGIVQKPWGNRDFRVRDDSGNELKFTEPLTGGDA
jgi:uncharacterized glyoxalase superfamily protein PhnB